MNIKEIEGLYEVGAFIEKGSFLFYGKKLSLFEFKDCLIKFDFFFENFGRSFVNLRKIHEKFF